MNTEQRPDVAIRLWSEADLPLLERLMGNPAMTVHLGGPETAEKIRDRHARYCKISDSSKGYMFVIVVGEEQAAVGSVGYWEKQWQGQQVWETGWSVLPEFQGQGLAARAVAEVVEQARSKASIDSCTPFRRLRMGPRMLSAAKRGLRLKGMSNSSIHRGQSCAATIGA